MLGVCELGFRILVFTDLIRKVSKRRNKDDAMVRWSKVLLT
jgi:hypothetical protein